jgi:hypothetical protein
MTMEQIKHRKKQSDLHGREIRQRNCDNLINLSVFSKLNDLMSGLTSKFVVHSLL